MNEGDLLSARSLEFLAGGGECGARMRALDWSKTPLGAPEGWPQSLRSAVSICLGANFPIAIYWGSELALIYNDAWSPIPGEKHPRALGRPGREVWPEIWDTIGPLFEKVQSSGEGVWQEDQLLPMRRHGYTEECYFNFTFSPIRGEGGKVEGIFNAVVETTFRVISERRERMLRRLAECLVGARAEEDVFDMSAQALATDSADLPFCLLYRLDSGGRHARLATSSGAAPSGPAWPQSVDLDDAAAPWPLARVVESGRAEVVSDLTTRFGFPLPGGPWPEPSESALIAPIAVKAQSGEIDGFLIAGVSPRRALNDEYRAFIERAADHVSVALANARAYEDERKRAEALAEIDRAKTTFFSNASHEFRTPLTLMLGPLEDLLARARADDVIAADRREVDLIHRNGLRLLKLVNTLLDFSRIEAGRVQAVYEPTDLAVYTAELASTFRSAMDKAGLRYVVDCAPLPQPVYVDRDMWEKIVLNLVSNAFKYTLEGEVRVGLRPAPDGASVELTVRDTGVGIPADELPRMFERFHRIAGQRGRTHEGTGIGLALVHELVRLHGGTVRAESAVGRGTTFFASIPFGQSHLPADRIEAAHSGASTGLRAEAFVEEALRWLPGERTADIELEKELIGPGPAPAISTDRPMVLLADDNADMRDYVRRLLAPRYEVEAVPDGRAALDAARARRPDLILSDVMMPVLDGFGLLNALRADPNLGDVPIILLSARAGEEAKVEGLEAGADDYLIKPFGARELLARVATNLEMARLRRRATETVREEARRLQILNRTGAAIAAELDVQRLVQMVTDAAVQLTGAKFGAFFYNVLNEQGESYTLYTLSGAPREAFEKFPMPRNTAVFGPTFRGERVVRSDDILKDPNYGKNPPYHGMPQGHLPVRSYLAVPVISRSGEVLGGLFFGHSEPGVFSERDELIVTGIAGQAAIAIDNARLYQASQKAADDLRRLNATLEQRVVAEVGERMKMEAAFRQAQKMEAVGQLTGGIAHDFNNLLTVIIGSLDLLHRRVPEGSENLRRPVEAAMRGAQRAAALTQRLLAFSRRQPLEPKPVDMNRLVAGMSDLLRRTLGETIAIETVLAGGLWWVSVDANQLESALLNLAVNARDAMPKGGKLTIETANTYLDEAYAAAHDDVEQGQYAMLAVTDTGTGMSKDIMEKAFEPFFTTKDIGQGTGLGLSQVYGFIKQSGGHVKIYSELGQGTTVKIYLPRLVTDDVRDSDDAARDRYRATRTETILVVEDEKDVRAYSVEVLRELGYRVLEAADAAAGLRMLDGAPDVRLLFTDVGLPGGLNGRQLADEARRRRPDLKVLFTTGYARNAIVHQGRLDPGVELIVKPFTYATLGAKIRQLFASE